VAPPSRPSGSTRSSTFLSWKAVAPALALGGLAPACEEPPEAGGGCSADLAPGDLVITEIMANPAGTDRGREWLELHNASPRSIALDGVVLSHSREDGSSERRHTLRGVSVEPGEYLVVGDAPRTDLPPHVDYGLGNALGPLRNTGGRLAVSCRGTVLGEVVFGAMADGVAWGFDGGQPVHYLAASEYGNWCAARSEYSPGERGTPGGPNDVCPGAAAEGLDTECEENGVVRALEPPGPGDLRLSELMPKSGAVPDADGEWLEIEVRRDVDLNGVSVALDGRLRLTFGAGEGECVRRPAGSFVLLARRDDPEVNGGLPPVDFTVGFNLPNTGDRVLSLHRGDALLDSLAYGTSDVRAGVSLARDAITGGLCLTPRAPELVFGAGDHGTPGAPNPACPAAEEPLPQGTCDDAGVVRDLRPPEPGDLRLSELMPKSGAVPDADGEWFEIEVRRDVDLAGVSVVLDGRPRLVFGAGTGACLSAAAGTFVLLARRDDPDANGGLPPVDFTFGFNLPNTGDRVLELHVGETVLDTLAYGTALVRPGASIARDPVTGDLCLTPREPDLVFGAGDHGTPGAPNPPCGEAVEPPPETDEPVAAGCEENGVVRDPVPPGSGDLRLSELMPKSGAVPDADGEWFELEVRRDVDLSGVAIALDGTPRLVLGAGTGACLPAAAGTFVLLARRDDPDANGGLPPVDFTFGFNLPNTGDRILSLHHRDALLDTLAYGTAHVRPGLSIARDPEAETICVTPSDPALVFGAGDHGTPAAPNPSCPVVDAPLEDGQCEEAGVVRPARPPGPGELLIREIMADTASPLPDADGEWFEVEVLADLDLNGLVIAHDGQSRMAIESARCLSVAAGSRVVLARNADPAVNGGLPQVDFTFGFNLVNRSAQLSLHHGSELLDEVVTLAPQAGRSIVRDVALGLLCHTPRLAELEYAPNNFGSPGQMPPPCP
jgi:hypothetical protein